jgi:KipI family sensor histidine kinase inhibitor
VLALDSAIASVGVEGITETVPTYRSLMVHFDPRRIRQAGLITRLKMIEADVAAASSVITRDRWSVPICYDGDCAEDLTEVAEKLGMRPDRVVSLHSQAVFRLYMYGFAPGYAYLGGLPSELNISRRTSPRRAPPYGSVVIAGGQALIFTISMPTGWYVIGRTPERLFDLQRSPNFIFQVGDELVMERIDRTRFDALAKEVEAGRIVARKVE